MSDELRDKRLRSETQISEQLDERLTMNGNKSNTQIKVYAKNSFDRFGDDLTEEILQYLTFEDKIRLECVSKQWQRCVFQRQFVIELEHKPIEKQNSLNKLCYITNNFSCVKNQSLKSVMKKCPNITKVKLWITVNNSVLSLIGRYCHRIKSLTYQLYTEDRSLSFFQQYGHKLEELYLYSNNEIIEQYLRHCPNLKNVFIRDKSFRFPEDKEFLPKLVQIKSVILTLNLSKDLTSIKILSDKYSKTLKTLNVTLRELTTDQLKTHIDCISRFENLQSLTLKFCHLLPNEPIDDYLILIGQKCNKLLKLDLSINCLTPKTDRLFDALSEFKTIKKLKLYFLQIEEQINGSVECFKHCKQLNELDIQYNALREDFFINIEKFVPKLRTLKIETYQQFSDSFQRPFHSMKSIQSVELLDKNKLEKKFWYFRKRF